MIPLIQQSSGAMDQLKCSETDAESRSAERTGRWRCREEEAGCGLGWNGKIAYGGFNIVRDLADARNTTATNPSSLAAAQVMSAGNLS